MALDLCKYYKKQEYVSYNDGMTWQPLDNYERGELYESHSSSCGAGIFQYRWMQINNGYICDGKDRYSREIYQYSEDGEVWYNIWPTQYRKGFLIETNSPFCDNAGNGQYSSGGTDPISGDTEDCPPGYFWNGTECECNGQYVEGICRPCPDNTIYNKTTHQCECIEGHLDSYGNCIICPKYEQWDNVRKECYCPTERDDYGNCKGCPPNSTWSQTKHDCLCVKWYEMRNGVCVYIDPLKTIKCEDSNGILTSNDVGYYESGWTVISYVVGDCIIRIESGAFNGQTLMTGVTIPSSVVAVGTLAFGNCKSLTSITFPSSLGELGNSAFKGCEKLKTVNFGGSIPSTLNNAMFSGCTALESASWLNNITAIGNNAFAQCTSLTSVTFSQNLSTIGYNAFFGCNNLDNILIPSATTSIGAAAFKDCLNLTNVVINSQNILIDYAAFANCQSLTAITINSSGVTMSNNVFDGCTRLLKMTFTSPTPFEISQGEFDNTNNCAIFVPCESLQAYKTAWSQYADRISCNDTGIYYRWIDDSGTYCVGSDAYTRQKEQSTTNGITWTDTGNYRPITFITHYSPNCGYNGEVALTVRNVDGYLRYYEPCSVHLKFQATYNDYTAYSAECDSNTTLTTATTRGHSTSYTSMTNGEIGDCVTSIGDNAFQGCTSLANINIPDGVTNIGNYAFKNCVSLPSINISSGVTNIGTQAFYGCSGLTNLELPDGITFIGTSAFQYCSGLTRVTINATTPPTLGPGAFIQTNDCIIYVPRGSVDTYKSASGWNAYANRIQGIPHIVDGKLLAYFNDGTTCLVNCGSSSVLTMTEVRALSGSYTGMTSAEIGNCTTAIGDGNGAFRGCSSLTSVYIADIVRSIGSYTFVYCRNLRDINIPNSITSIGQYAFSGCSALQTIVIPDSVTSIGGDAFADCISLKTISIGSGITSIDYYALYYCTGLTSITITATTPPSLGTKALDKTNNCPIYVPSGSVSTYKNRWSSYASRIQAIT